MNMASDHLNPKLADELMKLALIHDDDIDTSDMPEVADWSRAQRGVFAPEKIKIRGYDVRAIANWFLDRASGLGHALSNLSLNKLVYLAQERSLVERKILLTPARIEAWQHGPVFREIYHAFKDAEGAPVRERAHRFSIEERAMIEAREEFDGEDERFLEAIMARFGHRTASQLRAISHAEGGPWHTVWHYRGSTNPGMEITPALIFEHAAKLRTVNERR